MILHRGHVTYKSFPDRNSCLYLRCHENWSAWITTEGWCRMTELTSRFVFLIGLEAQVVGWPYWSYSTIKFHMTHKHISISFVSTFTVSTVRLNRLHPRLQNIAYPSSYRQSCHGIMRSAFFVFESQKFLKAPLLHTRAWPFVNAWYSTTYPKDSLGTMPGTEID